ncbi:hypothetical protein VNI00_010639 [Paramarasmius palmivorus]|uniref:F-box domain-containing protein n=1 Tax=Paramarasmius palmivorus TaxID=297713 RepID=A0AAW0CJ44_9AGAR
MAILGLAMNHGLSFLPFTKTTAAGTACNTEFTSSSNELYISRNIISINTLPVELFTAIFELCLPNGLSSDPDVPALVHIISVCRHWRAVALMAPHLWARLMLWDPRGRQVKMVGQWLGRSQSCPLTLAIRHSSGDAVFRGEVLAATHQILTSFLRHLHRWKSITLRLERFAAFHLLPPDPAAAPSLERVEVCIGDACFDPQKAVQFWRTIFAYPALRRVSWICGSQPSYLTDGFYTGWERLTHIHSQFVVDDMFFDILACCRSLEVLDVESLEPSNHPIIKRDRVVIPSLRSLIIRDGGLSTATVLEQLVLPSLRKADLYLLGSGLKAWINLLTRSGCFIVDLALHIEGNTQKVDVAILLSAPSLMHLEKLEASFTDGTNFLVQQLACIADHPFPALRHLDLRLEVERCAEGSIAGMVQARTQCSHSALERIIINHYPIGSELAELSLDAQLLRQIHVDGLDVEYFGD